MSLSINNLNLASTLSIYLCIGEQIKEISLDDDTMHSLLNLYKTKLNFYTGDLIEYSNHYGYKKEREELYEYNNIDSLPKLTQYISKISNNSKFNIKSDKLENLNFYIVNIPLSGTSNILLFKKY